MKLHVNAGETPILDAVVRHAQRERISLHVPGHHQGRLLPQRFDAWFGQASKLDATEVSGLDNLHQASGPILRSRQLTAEHYGAADTFYSVNGSTACIMAAIAACVEETGKRTVIVIGPCHMSLWRALVHADAVPMMIAGTWSSELHMVQPPTPDQVQTILDRTTDIAALFATSPSYQGLVAPVAEYAIVAHRANVPLVVDEAHGAHFGLHPELPMHSVANDADVVIQSPHKTLPCVTQAAWVHVQSSLVRGSVLERHLLFLQTTSPSYILLSSLDAVQAWLQTSGRETAGELIEKLRPHLSARWNANSDPFRWWIPMPSAEQSRKFEMAMNENGIFLEYADDLGALAIFGMGQTAREIERFFEIANSWIARMDDLVGAEETGDGYFDGHVQLLHHKSAFVMTPRQVFYERKEHVHVNEVLGRVAGAVLSPYPPGVPYLWPGEQVTEEQVNQLRLWIDQNRTIVGLSPDGRMEVVAERGA